jgi:non-ribosomal peptide synthetase component E (peptide arylation enzyme)
MGILRYHIVSTTEQGLSFPPRLTSQSMMHNVFFFQVLEEGYIKEVPRWFPGARLNYAENLLWRADDGVAITEYNEAGHITSYSYRELREQVRKLAAALKAHGLQPGDRVAGLFRVTLPRLIRLTQHSNCCQ